MSNKLSKELKQMILQNMFVKNYKRMWPYIKPVWFRALLTLLLAIPVGSLDAVIAMSIRPYMDVVMIDKSMNTGWYIPIIVIGFTCLQGGLTYLLNFLNTWVGGKITNFLKADLFKKMLTLETEYFTKRNSGDIMMEFSTNADTACSGLLDNLKSFVQKFFTSVSLIFVLFYNSWHLAIGGTLIMLGAFIPMMFLRKKVNPIMEKSVNAKGALLTAYNESYAGNKTVISYNLEAYQKNKFKGVIEKTFNLTMKLFQHTNWVTPVMHVILSVGIGLAIWFGSYLIFKSVITPGSFVSFLTALVMLYTPIKSLGGTYNSLLMSFWAIEKVFNILDTQPQIQDAKEAIELPSTHKQICFNDVSFEYIKNVPV
ncbi:MAG: ABC transporter, partial [Alphaproteobacteria bacterium]|nr:ABC transporter [Alphaproteobacteria bacterium]